LQQVRLAQVSYCKHHASLIIFAKNRKFLRCLGASCCIDMFECIDIRMMILLKVIVF